MARKPHPFHGQRGVLGVVPSSPSVVAVFPELSSTILPHAQELRVRRGDTMDLEIQFQDDRDPPSEKAVYGSILRWAAKQGYGDSEGSRFIMGNREALIVKRSYDTREIAVSGSRATVHVTREDTFGLPLSPAVWDLELTVPRSEIQVPPEARATALFGSDLIAVNGIDLSALVKAGDIIEYQGKRVIVASIPSPLHLKADFSGWRAGEPGPFSLWASRIMTVASGPFEVVGDVVR